MRLQSRDSFQEIGRLDDGQAPLVVLSREDADAAGLLAEPLAGHFAQVGGLTAALFRWRGRLYLRLGQREIDVEAHHAVVRWTSAGVRRRLEVAGATGAILAAVDYEVPDQPVAIALDPTPFVEDEDFDFGQFVAHVLRDADRRERIYR